MEKDNFIEGGDLPLNQNTSLGNIPDLNIKANQATKAAVRVLLNLIPSVGGALTEALEFKEKLAAERQMKFLCLLKEYFEQVNGDEIDSDFLRSEDWIFRLNRPLFSA
jgi:hypothetical protein